jgi:hypothetical protein
MTTKTERLAADAAWKARVASITFEDAFVDADGSTYDVLVNDVNVGRLTATDRDTWEAVTLDGVTVTDEVARIDAAAVLADYVESTEPKFEVVNATPFGLHVNATFARLADANAYVAANAPYTRLRLTVREVTR